MLDYLCLGIGYALDYGFNILDKYFPRSGSAIIVDEEKCALRKFGDRDPDVHNVKFMEELFGKYSWLK